MNRRGKTCILLCNLSLLFFTLGCGSESELPWKLDPAEQARLGELGADSGKQVSTVTQAIVNVAQTPVERQAIGNCWIYAATGWAESMHLRATDDRIDLSESYWTYMHWYRQIIEDSRELPREIATGGNFYYVKNIVRRYGWMVENAFIPVDAAGERADSQSRALLAVNAALAEDGALATAESRQDPVLVRAVLDEAWELSEDVRSQLDSVFGPDMYTDFTSGAETLDSGIKQAHEFEVTYTTGPNTGLVQRTLAEALREWKTVGYSKWRARESLRRMQMALHQAEPVVLTWFVDFNALEYDPESPFYGSFNMATLEAAGEAGSQGGHMTVLEDYEATLRQRVGSVLSEQLLEFEVPSRAFTHVELAGEPYVRLGENELLSVVMRGTGDADLYVQKGLAPDPAAYACRPYSTGSDEECEVIGPADVYVAIGGYANAVVDLSVTQKVFTIEDTLLEAGQTLDPDNTEDAALLDAALADNTTFHYLQVKNSWGALRPDLPMASTDDRGYHNLYFDYLEGPIADEVECEEEPDDPECSQMTTPMSSFFVPPGY